MKKTLLATTAAVLVAGSAAAVDVELYGQVNKGVYGFDDGHRTDYIVVDNQRDSTRFGLKGAQALDNGLTASVLLEGELVDNASDLLTQQSGIGAPATGTAPVNSANGTFTSRQARVGLSGNFGGLYVGKQSTASDGAYRQDLAGVSDVMGASFNEIGGGLAFRNAGPGTLATVGLNTLTVNSLSSRLDENRANSVRYDSPIFAGFQGRAAIAQGGDLDLGVFYDGGFGDFKIAGAASAYYNNDETDFRGLAINSSSLNADSQNYAASLSVAHNSGLAATVAWQADQLDRKAAGVKDPVTWYAKVGYSWDAYEVAADYGKAEDYTKTAHGPGFTDDELKVFGLGAQYNLTDGVSLAALYRNFDGDRTGANLDSISLYGVNMKVKF